MSRNISHRGDVAAAISGPGGGIFLCRVLYVFYTTEGYSFRNERYQSRQSLDSGRATLGGISISFGLERAGWGFGAMDWLAGIGRGRCTARLERSSCFRC